MVILQYNKKIAQAEPPHTIVEVINTEEKGSDVSLAVQMLNDAWLGCYDCAVVVSNDSDMAESMKLINEHHKNKVLGLITPGKNKTSGQLKKYAHFVKTIRSKKLLSDCQLPNPIPGTSIHKPADWY